MLKLTIHLTKKNVWIWLFGVSAVVLTTIGIIIPSAQWGVPPWKGIIVGLLFSAVVGATIMLFTQSREDHEREEKEKKLEAAQDTLMTQVAQLAAKAEEKSSATTQNIKTTLSSLSPGVDFKFDDYFRIAHVSQLTEQTSKDIKILAEQQHPNDTEETLARFIGIGFWGYMHEVTWPYIFRSQILSLTELNARGGRLPLAAIRAHFDKATIDFPETYKTYTFDQWINFMLTHSLFITHPGDIVEITVRGRDFLVFMAHWGWNPEMRWN